MISDFLVVLIVFICFTDQLFIFHSKGKSKHRFQTELNLAKSTIIQLCSSEVTKVLLPVSFPVLFVSRSFWFTGSGLFQLPMQSQSCKGIQNSHKISELYTAWSVEYYNLPIICPDDFSLRKNHHESFDKRQRKLLIAL